ncbi:hypothetical protein TRVL_01895 [Trypanosoma vivax]|nr:hypothetical protein TRVL_01895 [Trypanosoma vivax]
MGDTTIEWLDCFGRWLVENSDPGVNHDGVNYTEFLRFLQNTSPPPLSLQNTWKKNVWRLRGEPTGLYSLRCMANVCGDDWEYRNVSFLVDPKSSLTPLRDLQLVEDNSALHYFIIRIIALRLRPSMTGIIQLGWRPSFSSPAGQLRPVYSSRTHVVLELVADGRHFSAWAYGDVGVQLRVGEVLCASMYESCMEDGSPAYAVHSVSECWAVDVEQMRARPSPLVSSRLGSPTGMNALQRIPSPFPYRYTFEQLVESFAPEIEGQVLCKSLLLLVCVHSVYRAVRSRALRPIHLLLLGSLHSGKSALLRATAELLGPYATLVGTHVVHGPQRSATPSQAITALYPHERHSLLLGGAVLNYDALIIDDFSNSGASNGCTNHVEALLAGLCPVSGTTASSYGHVSRIRPQVIAAANSDHFNATEIVPHFTIVARTTADMSLHSASKISNGVIAASVARSQSTSRARSWSTLNSQSGGARTGLLDGVVLRNAVFAAPSPEVVESGIPADAFARFYICRLLEHWQQGTNNMAVLTSQLVVLWGLNVAYMVLRCYVDTDCRSGCDYETNAPIWSESCAEEVWQSYKHHLWVLDTLTSSHDAAAHTCLRADTRLLDLQSQPANSISGTASLMTKGFTRKGRTGKKALCLALLRRMANEQRLRGGVAVREETARSFFEQLGGEDITGQSFTSVIQQLMDSAFLIRKTRGYAVVSEI